MTPAKSLSRYLKKRGWKFLPACRCFNKYNVVVENGQGKDKFNVYRGNNGETHWNIPAAKVKRLLQAE